MILPFYNRIAELKRLSTAFGSATATLTCLYGRRRCGKSRLLQRSLEGKPSVYYVGDERETPLQCRSLATEIGRLLPGFERAEYNSWDDLFFRWYNEAPDGSVLALDEFPYMVSASPDLAGTLQKYCDKNTAKPVHLCLCGSSQRMMHGLVLDESAPLYGRAREILKIEPLPVRFLGDAMQGATGDAVVAAYSVWGGVPRYWELANEYPSTWEAIRELVGNPLGVLYREPHRLLSDQMRDTRQAASLLSVIGQGCHRMTEIAARIGKPATSLTRPLAILTELGLVNRDIPFGVSQRDSKRSLYTVADPFLRFWLQFIEPNRSVIEAGLLNSIEPSLRLLWSHHVGAAWEALARRTVAYLTIDGRRWKPALRWWGKLDDGQVGEIDIVAESIDTDENVLVGEVKHSASPEDIRRHLVDLEFKARRCPALKSKKCFFTLWILKGVPGERNILTADDIVGAQRD